MKGGTIVVKKFKIKYNDGRGNILIDITEDGENAS